MMSFVLDNVVVIGTLYSRNDLISSKTIKNSKKYEKKSILALTYDLKSCII